MFQRNSDMFGGFGGHHGGPLGGHHGGPHGDFDGGFGGVFRAGRGMMEPAILQALLQKPMHGYEIISMLSEKTHGIWRPSPGSIYPTLQLLEEKDLVTSSEVDGKKVYTLTDAGKSEAESTKQQYDDTWQRRFEKLHEFQDMRVVMGESVRMIRNIHRKGTSEQKLRLEEALNDFARKLRNIMEEAA